jgi:hypothetical protein
MIYTDKMIDSNDYHANYSGTVHRYIDQLDHIELSCLSRIFSDSSSLESVSSKIYADILRLNAKMILADAKAIRPLTDEKHTLESSQLALKATSLGLEVLRPTYLTDKDQREHNTNFLERIQASDIVETYDRLSTLQSTLTEVVSAAK